MNSELQKAIEEDRLVLFVGAGMSMSLGFPNWNKLVEQILNHLNEEHPSDSSPINFPYYINALKSGSKNVLDILEVIDNGGYKKEVKTMLYEIINGIDYEGKDLTNQKKLWEISDKIITTNYDKVLDETTPKGIEVFSNDNPFQQVQSIKGKPFLYKIHGDITNPNTCILFKSDYEDLYKGDKSNTQTLRNFLLNKTLLFLGFSLDDPFITAQIEYLYGLYSDYGNKHFIVLTSQKDLSKYHVKTIPVENWNEGFDNFLNELIEVKKNAKKTVKSSDTVEEVDINTIEDISVLESIYEAKIKEANPSSINDESRKATKEIFRLRDRIIELQTRKYLNLDKQLSIPDLDLQELEHLFEVIYNAPKLSTTTKTTINNFKERHNSKYKWYHRSTIVSALACSIVNHKDLDPVKIDFLIDFANDAEEKVWQKAITYLFLVLNHLGNKWLRFNALHEKLKRIKENPELQQALKEIITIIQFEFQSKSLINKQVLEHNYFKNNPFHYFIPFYEKNSSIDKLYDRDDIEEVDNFIQFLYKVPLPDSLKYLVCNTEGINPEKKSTQDESENRSSFLKTLALHDRFEPFLNIINSFISFYKNAPDQHILLNETLSVISVKNFKDHLLNTIESYRTMGMQFMLKNDWDIAITNWNSLLKINPNDREALLYLIQCLENVDAQLDKQLQIRKQIEVQAPKNDDNLFKLGELYSKKNLDIDAIIYYDKAIEVNNNNSKYFNGRGISNGKLKNYKEAMLDFDKALNIDQEIAAYYGNRARVNEELENYNGALLDINKAIEINPKEEGFFAIRADIKVILKDYRGALLDYTIAIELNSKEADYYSNRASINSILNFKENALSDINKAIDINPKKANYYNNKSSHLRMSNNFNEAHRSVDISIQLDPDEGRYYGTKATIFSSEDNETAFYKYLEISFTKGAKAAWLDKDIKEKYRNEVRFKDLLQKYHLTLDEE